jgi:hypothetical protein
VLQGKSLHFTGGFQALGEVFHLLFSVRTNLYYFSILSKKINFFLKTCLTGMRVFAMNFLFKKYKAMQADYHNGLGQFTFSS